MKTFNTNMVKYTLISASLWFFFPLVSFAQRFDPGNELLSFGLRITDFIGDVLVPFILGIALLLFIYGIYMFFILGATDQEKRKDGKKFLLWSVIAFVIILSVWGIVNLIASGIGLDSEQLQRGDIPSAR